MRTDKKEAEMLKRGEITLDMLGRACYSVNKRAKNMRDKEWEYRYRRDCFRDWYGRSPHDKYDNIGRYREAKNAYYEKKDILLSLVSPTCVHKEKIYNDRTGYLERYNYYLFYEVGDYTFHRPINEERLTEWSNLPISELKNFETFGQEIQSLMSMQTVSKIIDLIKSNSITLVD